MISYVTGQRDKFVVLGEVQAMPRGLSVSGHVNAAFYWRKAENHGPLNLRFERFETLCITDTVLLVLMAAKKRQPSAESPPPDPRLSHLSWPYYLIAVLVLCGLVFGGYSLYLAKTVRISFEGKRWAVPARVYARSLELYVGKTLSAEQLRYELRLLGYRHMRDTFASAQWSEHGEVFVIRSRDFHFADGLQSAQAFRLRFAGNTVAGLVDLSTQRNLSLVRLEPVNIGSIYPSHREDRILLRHSELPEYLVDGLLAVEDRRFYQHIGIDLRSILRAVWVNMQAGRMVQGGSTLTQQAVKNFVLTQERSLRRKLHEALMALMVEARYGKDDILEVYVNEVFLGQDGERAIHGFGLAAQYYFNRPLHELQVHEIALLVGLAKGASFYNPIRHPQRAKQRRDLVLQQMHQQGFIEANLAERAQQRPLGLAPRGRQYNYRYPGFIGLVRQQLQRDYQAADLVSEGLRIFTTLDPWAQQLAIRAVNDQLARHEKRWGWANNTIQAALVLAEAQSGEIRALLGGRTQAFSGFNRALSAARQVGSLIKPAVYLTALQQPQRYTLATELQDKPISIKLANGDLWRPRNHDRKMHGQVRLHQALTQSYNLATVHLGMRLGLNQVIDTLGQLGVKRDLKPYPSLLLGAVQLSPLEMAQVYQTVAAGGFRAPIHAIKSVSNHANQPLQGYPLSVRQTVDPAANYLLTANLMEVVQQGTGRSLSQWLGKNFAVAGKTGTTNQQRDSWFAGFGADLVGVVWVGRDDQQSTKLSGATGALPIFGQLMRRLNLQPLDLTPPQNIAYHWLDAKTGYLSAEQCKGAKTYPFIAGSQPKKVSGCARWMDNGDWSFD